MGIPIWYLLIHNRSMLLAIPAVGTLQKHLQGTSSAEICLFIRSINRNLFLCIQKVQETVHYDIASLQLGFESVGIRIVVQPSKVDSLQVIHCRSMLFYFSLKCRPYTLKNRYLQLYCICDSILEGKFFQVWGEQYWYTRRRFIALKHRTRSLCTFYERVEALRL